MWSYHAWDVGFASHKINSFSSLSTLCLGCLRIVGWLHLKAPLESFPNLSILNQESDYLHTANKKSETNFWRKKWFHSCLRIVERLHLKAPLGSLFLLKAFLGIPLESHQSMRINISTPIWIKRSRTELETISLKSYSWSCYSVKHVMKTIWITLLNPLYI